MAKREKKQFQAKPSQKESIMDNEIINTEIIETVVDPEIKVEAKKEKENFTEVIDKFVKNYSDTKIRFAKVHWGHGKGPYLLAFKDSLDYNFCECNAHDFKPLKDGDIKQNKIHLWEMGVKTPDEVGKLPILDMENYRENLKNEKLKKKEEKLK